MNEKIINYKDLKIEYDDMAVVIIKEFEQVCFDQNMEKLLQGMLNKDWGAAMLASYNLFASAGYIKAFTFVKIVKSFYEFLKPYREFLKLSDNEIIAGRSYFKLKDEFDDEKKLQAYEYFHPIIEQASLLKLEMSKHTESQVTEDLFLAEGEKIKQLHQELIEHLKIKQVCENLIQKEQNEKVNQGSKNDNNITKLQNDGLRPNVVLEPPKDDICCNKCFIF